MIKNIFRIFTLCIIIVSCNQNKQTTPEEQQKELTRMIVEADIIRSELADKSGNKYLAHHDKYYDMKYTWIKTAMKYARSFNLENKTEDEIRRMADIAKTAKNEQQVVDIIKEDFHRFPESKIVPDLVQMYFNHAYLLEPSEIERYVDFHMFAPGEELYYYTMLAFGFSELGMIAKAKEYVDKMNNLLAAIIADPVEKHTIPLLYIVGLHSYIAYRIGDKDEAYNIIEEAEKEFSGEDEKNHLSLYRNRLHILENNAVELESRHWIGTGKPLSLSALKGKVILLDFFTWECEPCTIDILFLKRLQEQINNEDFMIIGVTRYCGMYEHEKDISEQTEYEYMKKHYYKKRRITWPLCMNNASMSQYGIYTLPTYLLIDKEGIVRSGYYIYNFTYVKKKIDLLLEEK
jgi:thiol-disulfide isomerase/thioredoxin